jgi:alpha-1,2-mannosyltransferase
MAVAMERMRRIVEGLRSGSWVTRERMRLAAVAVLIASTSGLVFLIATSDGRSDLLGRPLGTDFSNVYAAGTMVLEGRAAAAFDPAPHHAREQEIFGAGTPFYGWHYPPFFLFVAAALAGMPHALALLVWQATTFGLYVLAMGTILRRSKPPLPANGTALALLLTVAFPAVFINLGHGHNGFLSAALLGGALVLLHRPIIAGILFGLLAYKPQFGLMIPLVLAATGQWRAIAAAAVTVAALVVVTTLVFGLDIWSAFLTFAGFTRAVVLEQGNTGWHKIQSVFSWVRMWGGTVALAYAAQAAATLVIAAALVWLWRSSAAFPLKAAGLCLATVLATPYSLDYDLMVVAPALAFLTLHGLERGFAPWEKTALATLWLVPLFARVLAQATLVPIGVMTLIATFLLVLHRSVSDTRSFGWNSSPRALS